MPIDLVRLPRLVPILIGLLLSSVALIGGVALAGVADLSYRNCWADSAASGCQLPAVPALDSAREVAISPDGNSVYVTSGAGFGAISHFTRAANGSLSYQACFADTNAAGSNAEGCTVPANAALEDVGEVAVSPGGNSVYVTSADDRAISFFTRADDGSLLFQGCSSESGVAGCVPGSPALSGAEGVAVSPDGKSVYVVASNAGAISHFTRADDGSLLFQGCLADTADDGCSVPADPALAGAQGVAVSPDGDSVYVASNGDGSISQFSRAANGNLSYRACFADTNAEGCTVPGNAALDGAGEVKVSPDGDSVYVVSRGDSSISQFSRAANGNLLYRGCFADTAAAGCSVPADPALLGAGGVAVSPDGGSVYVTSSEDDSISGFNRGPNGNLSYQGCLADTASAGCSVPADPALASAFGLAVSPGGDSVYVAAADDSSISHFRRDPLRCGGRTATSVGSGKADSIRGTAAADVIVAQGGNDVVRGLGKGDRICGGPGRDRLIGGPGGDRLLGQAGRDTLKGGPGRDLLKGGPGRDLLLGGPGKDRQRQ